MESLFLFLRYLNKTNKSKKRLSATQEEYLQFLESHNLVYKKKLT